MPITNRYQTESPAINSYDFTDVLLGTSYELMYGGQVNELSASSGAILRNFVFDSDNLHNGQYTVFTPNAGAGYLRLIDYDFDIELGNNVILEGEALCNFTFSFYNATGGAEPSTVYVTTEINKWDGTTETFIASGATLQYTKSCPATSLTEFRLGTKFDVPTTGFKNGETIRLTVKMDNKTAANLSGYFLHDPSSRAIANVTDTDSTLKIWLPFKTDI
ncbi:MAG: hypothetical protein ABIB11_06100 [Candidatus Omnitrophota bacterium]